MVRALLLATFLCGSSACGGGDPAEVDAGDPIDAASLALSSSAITEGGSFPTAHTCDGADRSPALAWSGAPADSAGFAVVLTDTSIDLIHWVIWDLPGEAEGLVEGVAKVAEPDPPAGAKQTLAYDQATRGYLGPCPPSHHDYRFTLYAVDQAPLPGVDLESTRAEVSAALAGHALASATLSAGYGE